MPNGFAAASCAASLRLRDNLSQILVMPMIIASWRGRTCNQPELSHRKITDSPSLLELTSSLCDFGRDQAG